MSGTGRDESAAGPQQRVVSTAVALFTEQGYAATSVRQIARQAKVSLDTVYACGSKAEIFLRALEIVLSGSADGTPLLDAPGLDRVWQAPTLREVISGLARVTVEANARAMTIWPAFVEGAGSEDRLRAALVEKADAMRAEGRRTIEFLKGRGLCDPDIDTHRVGDLIWAEAHPDRYALLVCGAGWTPDEFADQLTERVVALLDHPPQRAAGGQANRAGARSEQSAEISDS